MSVREYIPPFSIHSLILSTTISLSSSIHPSIYLSTIYIYLFLSRTHLSSIILYSSSLFLLLLSLFLRFPPLSPLCSYSYPSLLCLQNDNRKCRFTVHVHSTRVFMYVCYILSPHYYPHLSSFLPSLIYHPFVYMWFSLFLLLSLSLSLSCMLLPHSNIFMP